MLCTTVPTGMKRSGSALPGRISAPWPFWRMSPTCRTLGGEDVALLAVVVVQQGDPARAVRVVLDRGDRGRHAVLVPPEVDLAVLLLVPAAAVTRGLAAVVVATTGLGLALDERTLGRGLGDLGEVGLGLEPTSGAGGLAPANGHGSLPAQTSNSSMESPSARVIRARLVSGRLP